MNHGLKLSIIREKCSSGNKGLETWRYFWPLIDQSATAEADLGPLMYSDLGPVN